MAWIAVHDTIDGPKLRKFRKLLGCSHCEAEGILTCLWRWGKENADDTDGKILDADIDDVSAIFSGKVSENLQPEKVVDCLIESGWLDLKRGGLYIHDWTIWQEQWIKAKVTRAKDAQRKRESRMAKMQQELNDAEDSKKAGKNSSAKKEAEPEKEDNTPTPKTLEYSVPFERFWSVYPRKVEKGNAYKKYKTRRKDGFSDEQLYMAAKAYAEECEMCNTEAKFIKHPKTFLSDALPFRDYLPKGNAAEVKEDDGDNPFGDWKEE